MPKKKTRAEVLAILDTYDRLHGNVSRTARDLGISRATVRHWVERVRVHGDQAGAPGRYPSKLDPYGNQIAFWRDNGASPAAIARDLFELYGIEITAVSVRRWINRHLDD